MSFLKRRRCLAQVVVSPTADQPGRFDAVVDGVTRRITSRARLERQRERETAALADGGAE
jgi:hypothetical protein